ANSAQQPSPSAPAQAPVAPDTSSTKTLRFLAIDHDGNPITGLRVEDLSLRISGQSRKIVSLSPAATQSLDIGIFFDISGSRRSDQLIPQEVQATSRFLESIWSPGDFGFAVAFGEIPVTLTKPTQYLQEIEEGLQKIPGATYRGSTAIYDALASVHVTGKPSGRGEKLFIVVGDFEDNSSHKSEDKTIETLRDEGIRIFPLLRMENDVYSSRYRHHANEIAKKFARSTGGDILVVSNQKDLDNAFRRITNELRSSYRLTYEPLPNEGELKKIQIKSSRPNLELFFPHD
ncbi:MAG: VWA domain-containing protein, partial [Nitrososphaerales archaeon]